MRRSRDLEELTLRLYEAVSRADASFFDRYLSRAAGGVVIGTAPHEWWDSADRALDAIRNQMAVGGETVQLRAGELRGYEEGGAGWVADRPTLKVGDIEVRCRHTSVFVRENGEWRLVQHHFSIGISNEDVFGEHATRLG